MDQPGPKLDEVSESHSVELTALVDRLNGLLRELLHGCVLVAGDWPIVEELLDSVEVAVISKDVDALRLALDELKIFTGAGVRRDSDREQRGSHDIGTGVPLVPTPTPVRERMHHLLTPPPPPPPPLSMTPPPRADRHRPGAGRPVPHQTPPEPRPSGRTPEPVRYVNTVLATAGVDSAVPTDRPLQPATRYDLLVNVGGAQPQSLLPAAEDTAFPDGQLPDGDLHLRAVLRLDSMAEPLVVPFSLPDRGDSFTCDCPPRAAHRPDCERRPWVRFPLTTPAGAGHWHGELVIYYETVAVHAQRLDLPVGDGSDGGPHATMTYRLTSSFSKLRALAGRTASILVSSNASRVMVNGLSFVDSPFSLQTNAADTASRRTRDALYDIHFVGDEDGGAEISRYDHRYAKTPQEFEADLRKLAWRGHQVYCALFDNSSVSRSLWRLIRHEANALDRPPVLCVAEPRTVQESSGPIPWSLIYDLPVGDDMDRYQPCESVYRFGPGGDGGPIPARCPVDHSQQGDVLCPFGFWGLSCILEQLTQRLRRPGLGGERNGTYPWRCSFRDRLGTRPDITARHLAALQSSHGDVVLSPRVDSYGALADALAEERMDVAYLYCHCRYHHPDGRPPPPSYLLFGGQKVGPLDIGTWADVHWDEPADTGRPASRWWCSTDVTRRRRPPAASPPSCTRSSNVPVRPG